MKVSTCKEIGSLVRAKRKELNYTQAFLSEFTGLSVSFISDFENGKSTIEIEKALHLIHTLGLDMKIENRGN